MEQKKWLNIFNDEEDKIKKICIKASKIHEDVYKRNGSF